MIMTIYNPLEFAAWADGDSVDDSVLDIAFCQPALLFAAALSFFLYGFISQYLGTSLAAFHSFRGQ